MLREHRELVQKLADELMKKVSLNEKELADWYAITVSTEPHDRTESAVKG